MDTDLQYATSELQTFPSHSEPLVVDQITVEGVELDIVHYATFTSQPKTTNDPGPECGHNTGRFYAIARGAAVRTLTMSFYLNDGPVFGYGGSTAPSHRAGDRAGGTSYASVTDSRDEIGKGPDAKAAITSAKKALQLRKVYDQFGPIAVANIATVTADDFKTLDETAPIQPGDLVVIYSHGRYRRGVAHHVTRTGTVKALVATPSGGYAQGATAKIGGDVRLYKATAPRPVIEQTPAPNPANEAAESLNMRQIGILMTGQTDAHGHGKVIGTRPTLEALQRRGLIDEKHCWTSLGRDVVATRDTAAVARQVNVATDRVDTATPMTAQPQQQHAQGHARYPSEPHCGATPAAHAHNPAQVVGVDQDDADNIGDEERDCVRVSTRITPTGRQQWCATHRGWEPIDAAADADPLPTGATLVDDNPEPGSWYGWRNGRRVCTFPSRAAGDKAIRAQEVDSTSPAEHYGRQGKQAARLRELEHETDLVDDDGNIWHRSNDEAIESLWRTDNHMGSSLPLAVVDDLVGPMRANPAPEPAPHRRSAMIPIPHPLANCGQLALVLQPKTTCPTCGTVVTGDAGQDDDGPVLDGDGQPVNLDGSGLIISDELRAFYRGRVRAPHCPHYMYASERRAGLTTCERCPAPAATDSDHAVG